MRRCPATKTGTRDRCRMTSGLDPETGLCRWHDPKRRAEVAAARKRGGHNGGGSNRTETKTVSPEDAPAPPTDHESARAYAAWLLAAVVTGTLDSKTVARADSLLKTWMQAHERSAQEEEIRELRDAIDELRTAQ